MTLPDVSVHIDPGVFNPVYIPHLNNMARTQIFYGGSASGKSVFLAQRDIIDLMTGGRNFLVCRAIGRSVRKSVFAEAVKVINSFDVRELFTINKTDGLITCANGYQMIFSGLDDTEKLKSITPQVGVITDVRIEEATEVDAGTIKDLYKRQRGGSESIPKRLTMSFNPILQSHHIYTTYFKSVEWADDQREHITDDLSIVKTIYKDNHFLTTQDHADLENETDKYRYNVYTLGNWGVLGHVIFTNWTVEDLTDMQPQFTNRRNGLDFGFIHPAALARTHYDREHKTIYIFDEVYERGLTNDVLAERVKPMLGDDYIICDSAEPKSIADMQNKGINALPAIKGKDSVTFVIQWLQQQKIVIDKSCVNARNEFMTYHWKQDAGGNSLPIPVDKGDDFIAALRYAYEEEANGSGPSIIGWP